MKVLEISLFLILTWAAQESQCGAPMEKTCCSEPDGCGDDYMCGKKTIPTSGDYEEDWGSIESIDVTSEPKIEICIGRRKLKKHFKVSLTFKISLFYAFPNFLFRNVGNGHGRGGDNIVHQKFSTPNFSTQFFLSQLCIREVFGEKRPKLSGKVSLMP